MSVRQKGYFSNIRQGIAVLQSSYFFWCEDDWDFARLPPLERALEAFEHCRNLAQLRVPKQKELLLEDKRLGELVHGVWAQDQSYSLNPHYGRTELMRRALAQGLPHEARGQNVEIALSRWMSKQGYIFAAWDPIIAHAAHFGQEVAGGHSDYRWHLVPEEGIAVGEAQAPPAAMPSHPSAQEAPKPASRTDRRMLIIQPGLPLRRFAVIWEFVAKALYALWAVTKAVISIPISRQARAFVRTIWRYWHPDFTNPSSVGPTCEDV